MTEGDHPISGKVEYRGEGNFFAVSELATKLAIAGEQIYFDSWK